MSTRATYTFVDDDPHSPRVHVYKHHDGYPKGAAYSLALAVPFAWKLPRFEADEFAAAFIAGVRVDHRDRMKEAGYPDSQGGGTRIIASGDPEGWRPYAADQEYHYEISAPGGALHVKCWGVAWVHRGAEPIPDVLIYEGPLEGLADAKDPRD